MYKSLSHNHNLLIYYLQTLNDAEMWQILYLTQWKEPDYSSGMKNFIVQQQQETLSQHANLKSLENTLNIHLTGGRCEPMRGLFLETENMKIFSKESAGVAEMVLIQLLSCIKHYEMVTYQAALTLARSLEETEVANALANIAKQEEQAYLQLQNLAVSHRQPQKVAIKTEIENIVYG